MSYVVAFALGLVVGGPLASVVSIVLVSFFRWMRRRPKRQPIRPILLVLLVELKSGRSILGALQAVAQVFPDNTELADSVRMASVSGLPVAIEAARPPIDGLMAQLARCQHSGAPATDFVRSMLEADIAAEQSRRMERARGLPIRLMVPISLLILPGLVLLLYAPALIRTWRDLATPLT